MAWLRTRQLKRALIALTEVIQEENRDFGIKAWALCPGMVDTPGGDDRGDQHRPSAGAKT